MRYLDDLQYIDDRARQSVGKGPLPIPQWAKFYAGLGASVTHAKTEGIRKVAALSLPTRAYCSPFVAAGVIAQQASKYKVETTPVLQHFERLKALPDGSSVFIRKAGTNKIQRGTKVGYEHDWQGYGPRLLFQVSRSGSKGGAITYLESPERCADVEVDPSGPSTLPIAPVWRELPEGSLFLSTLFQDVDLAGFYGTSSLECLILGQVNILDTEIRTTTFAIPRSPQEPVDGRSAPIPTGERFYTGTLQDILRVKRFGHDGGMYKADIWASQRLTLAEIESNETPRLVLFDGSQGFIKLRHFFRKSDWVIILDRTDPHYQEAVHGINDGFSTRASDEILNIDIPFPPGIDFLSYVDNI